MLITVDFDGTLTKSDVQSFVRDAISNGHKVVVVTIRHNEFVSERLFGQNENGWNTDVIELSTRLGCSTIYFTNGVEKHKYITPLGADLHLDNTKSEVTSINANSNTLALWVNRSDWEVEAKKILNSKK